MRRLFVLVALLSLLIIPAPVAGASNRCSIDVTPEVGTSTTTYRITGTDFPVLPPGRSLEVRIDIRLLGTRSGSILLLFLIPGVTEFYVDLNQAPEGEPGETLEPGRYLVRAETPHVRGCHTIDRFVVA
jgi:hypothetical protein